ncbi:MAG: DsbC family protein [Aquifex sp.]|nr:MAG: DsbC family protein [Aquifex sp.]
MFRAIGFLIASFLFSFASLYEEFIKQQVKELPLDKAVITGKGNKELIIFVNPDCPHCRKEWKTLRKYLDRLKLYVFVIPFKAWGEENLKKAYYIVCSQNPAKALDEALTGQLDDKTLNPEKCKKLEYHLKAAEMVGLRGVPLNILPKEGKIIEGANPKVFEYLGIKTHLE